MARNNFYRSLIVAAAAVAGLALTGCGGSSKNYQKASEQGRTSWNMARIGIIYQLAETQYKVGDYDKCNDTLKEAFATKAQFAPMYILSAKVDIERGNLEQANEKLNTAIRINPSQPEPYYLLGVLYQRWQKPETACDYYTQAWTRKNDEPRYMLAVVEMQMSLGRLDEAQATLESRIVYFEQSAAVRIALGRIASLKNDYTTASKHYRDALLLTPEDKNLRRSYGEALFYAGQFSNAVSVIEETRRTADPSERPSLSNMLGQCLLAMHRPQEARNAFQDAIRDNPNDNATYINLGKACIQTEELALATSAARKVLRADANNVQALIVIALVQQKQNKWNDAAATLEKAHAAAPTDSTVLCMLGLAAQNQGDPQRAVAFFQQAARANPNDRWAADLLNKNQPAQTEAPQTPPQAETPTTPAASITSEPAQTVAATPAGDQ